MGNLGKLGLVERLKNSNFILESKMTKSKSKKKKKNSKQSDLPDAE